MRRPDSSDALLLLGLLRQQRMHGYRLHDFIERDLASCTDLKRPTAYLLLDRLTAQGWIRRRVRRTGRRPERQEFAITRSGEAAFQRLLRENLGRFAAVRFPGDVGLAFLGALPPADTVPLLRARCALIRERLSCLRAVPPHGGADLVLDHLRHHLASEVRWLTRVVARLSKEEPRQ